jgi:hypothetical protein
METASDSPSVVVDLRRARADADYRAEIRRQVAEGTKVTIDMTGEIFEGPEGRDRAQERHDLLSDLGINVTLPAAAVMALAKFTIEAMWRKHLWENDREVFGALQPREAARWEHQFSVHGQLLSWERFCCRAAIADALSKREKVM